MKAGGTSTSVSPHQYNFALYGSQVPLEREDELRHRGGHVVSEPTAPRPRLHSKACCLRGCPSLGLFRWRLSFSQVLQQVGGRAPQGTPIQQIRRSSRSTLTQRRTEDQYNFRVLCVPLQNNSNSTLKKKKDWLTASSPPGAAPRQLLLHSTSVLRWIIQPSLRSNTFLLVPMAPVKVNEQIEANRKRLTALSFVA